MAVTGLPIAFGIISIFVLIGITLPFINQAFDQSVTNQADNLQRDVGLDSGSLSAVSALSIVASVAKMFFWTFGALPFWLDAIFLIFRVALILILIQYLPFVG